MKALLFIFMFGGCLSACGEQVPAFFCSTDGQCALNGTPGRCIERACAVPSADCASHWIFDQSAGHLAGQCAPTNDMGTIDMNPPDLAQPPPDSSPPRDSSPPAGHTSEACTAGTPSRACYSGPSGTRGKGACHDGMQTCDSSGFWTLCEGAVEPSVESCNGLDDDCDGVTDDGCPVDGAPLQQRQPTNSSFYGLSRSTDMNFTAECSSKSLAGFWGMATEAVDQIGIYCGTLTVKEDRSTTPYRYSVVVKDLKKGSQKWGGMGQDPYDYPCPPDEVITAFQATVHQTYQSLFGFNFECSKLALVGTPGSFTVKAIDMFQSPLIGAKNCPPADCVQGDKYSAPGGIYSMSAYYGPWPKYTSYTVLNGAEVYGWASLSPQLR